MAKYAMIDVSIHKSYAVALGDEINTLEDAIDLLEDELIGKDYEMFDKQAEIIEADEDKIKLMCDDVF